LRGRDALPRVQAHQEVGPAGTGCLGVETLRWEAERGRGEATPREINRNFIRGVWMWAVLNSCEATNNPVSEKFRLLSNTPVDQRTTPEQ
jgi:hypothetical protein